MNANTTLIRRIGKGYCAAGDGFYFFDEDLGRVLQWVAELAREADAGAEPPAARKESEA
jgi:hypothetical protein